MTSCGEGSITPTSSGGLSLKPSLLVLHLVLVEGPESEKERERDEVRDEGLWSRRLHFVKTLVTAGA